MKKILNLLLSLLLAFSILMPVIAEESDSDNLPLTDLDEPTTDENLGQDDLKEGEITFAQFEQAVIDANYNYDGNGVTVVIIPSSACEGTIHFNKLCTEENRLPAPDGNNPERVQGSVVQYQSFNGVEDIVISNVKFTFKSQNFSLCMNNKGWMGSDTINKAEDIKNAELQMQANGKISFTNCTFDGVILGLWGGVSGTPGVKELSISDCEFSGAIDAYAIKEVRASKINMSNNTFENCDGGILLQPLTDQAEINISNSTFTNCGHKDESKDSYRPIISVDNAGNISADITIDNLKAEGTPEGVSEVAVGNGLEEKGPVNMSVTNSEITVETRLPGLYDKDGNINDETKSTRKATSKDVEFKLLTDGINAPTIEGGTDPVVPQPPVEDNDKPNYDWVYRPSYNDSKDEEVKEYTTEDKTKACIELLGKGWEYSEKNKSCVYTLDSSTQQIPNTSTR